MKKKFKNRKFGKLLKKITGNTTVRAVLKSGFVPGGPAVLEIAQNALHEPDRVNIDGNEVEVSKDQPHNWKSIAQQAVMAGILIWLLVKGYIDVGPLLRFLGL